jgi:hypothetical protein
MALNTAAGKKYIYKRAVNTSLGLLNVAFLNTQ